MFSFENLVTPQEFHDRHPNVFGSVHGVEWFLRRHRKDLTEAGALIYLQKRKLIDVEAFRAFAVEVSKRNAEAA